MTAGATKNVVFAGLLLQAVAAIVTLYAYHGVAARISAGVPALALGALTGGLLYVALMRRIPKRPQVSDARALRSFALTGTALAVVAISEEIIWRGWAFEALRMYGPAAVLLITTAGFALMHALGQSFAGVRTHLATGLLFGVLRWATGSIGAAIVAHVAYNEIVLAQTTRANSKGDLSRAIFSEA